MKDFIRDDGKIRECHSNIAKMNFLTYYKYYPKNLLSPVLLLTDNLGLIKEMLVGLLGFILALIGIVIYPLSLVLTAIIKIKQAKKEVAYYTKKNFFKTGD